MKAYYERVECPKNHVRDIRRMGATKPGSYYFCDKCRKDVQPVNYWEIFPDEIAPPTNPAHSEDTLEHKHEYVYWGSERRIVRDDWQGMIAFSKKRVKVFFCKYCLVERVKTYD